MILQSLFASRRCVPIGLLLLAAGCGKQSAGLPGPSTGPDKVATVTVVKPERKTIRRVIEQPGSVEAFEETPLVVRIAGHVQKVHVDMGDRVNKGAVLAELDVPEMEVELKKTAALVRQAEAELKLARDSVPLAEAETKRMKSQFERLARIGSGVLDKENIEETRYGFEASKAKLEIAQSDVGVKEARLAVAQEIRDYAQAMLHYSKVRAPFDGYVVRRNVSTGHFLQPGTGAAAQPVFVVARADVVRVFVEVPEADAMMVGEATSARIRVPAVKGLQFDGKVTRSSRSLDSKARTLRVEIDLPNPQGLLQPGMYTYVTLTSEFPDRLTLPASAVIMQGNQTVCFQEENGKVVCVPVQLGLRDGAAVEVLKKQREGAWVDFTGKETFVQGGLSGLKDGQSVEVLTGKK